MVDTRAKTLASGQSLAALLVFVESSPVLWRHFRRMQLGLFYLAQYAHDRGHRVLVDTLSSNDVLVGRISRTVTERNVRVLGFYVDQENLWDVRRILPAIKDRCPGVSIVVGGPQITAAPVETMDRLIGADIGVFGDGEETFLELLEMKTLRPRELEGCAGLVFRASDGSLVTNPVRRIIENLDTLGIPDRKKLALEPFDSSAPAMITGRGCPARCAFCYEGLEAGLKNFRMHSVERCLEEFDYLVGLGANYIAINDDHFAASAGRLRQFCDGLIERYDGAVKWFCLARVDVLSRERNVDLLPKMVAAGLIRLQIGAESGSEMVLRSYNKKTTNRQLFDVAEAARDAGLLSLHANFIIGGALESAQTLHETFEVADSLLRMAPGMTSVSGAFFTPYTSTPMAETPERYGVQILDPLAVTGRDCEHVFCRTESLSKTDILSAGSEFDRRVDATMSELLPDLPNETIDAHMWAYYAHGISTEWYEELQSHESLVNWFAPQAAHTGIDFRQAADLGLERLQPVRTVKLTTAPDHGGLAVRSHRGLLKLSPTDGLLLELAAGKLLFEEIVPVVHGISGGKLETVRDNVARRYEELDKSYLIVWRETV